RPAAAIARENADAIGIRRTDCGGTGGDLHDAGRYDRSFGFDCQRRPRLARRRRRRTERRGSMKTMIAIVGVAAAIGLTAFIQPKAPADAVAFAAKVAAANTFKIQS